MNTDTIYRAITIGKNGTLINRESQNLTTFVELKCGELYKKEFVKEVNQVTITYNKRGYPVSSTCRKIA